jgi:hypothetical protein
MRVRVARATAMKVAGEEEGDGKVGKSNCNDNKEGKGKEEGDGSFKK